MLVLKEMTSGFSTPEARWARFGPYYAMFPVDFAFEVVEKYSKKGDYIIDPFAGRSSSIYAGGVLGRHSLGIEINPVGWLYGKVKLKPAEEAEVMDRLMDIYAKRNYYSRTIVRMPIFYRMCYCDEVLKFLLSARHNLNWKANRVDATLMAILLVYLHGKIGEGLSNQLKMSKSMGMKYSIEWWKKHKLNRPPEINPLEFIARKIEWRYSKGLPKVVESMVIFGDSTSKLRQIVSKSKERGIKYSLLFTSPPYCSVTDYHADQWLRLWLLNEQTMQDLNDQNYRARFNSKIDYYNLLNSVFASCSEIIAKKSTVYVRTDKRQFTFNITLEVLKYWFPNHDIQISQKPFTGRTQTEIHGNRSNETGEIDIILRRK